MSQLSPLVLLLILAAPVWGAPAAAAQLDLFDEAALQHVDWPAGITHLAKGRMVAGDVTGDLMPDLVLLNGGKPVIAYGPAVHRSVFEVDFAASDIVLLPDPTPGTAARMMVVNSGGLYALTGYDGGVYDASLLPFTAWEGATRVTRGDTDGDGSLDLVGLSAAGNVLLLEDLETSSPTETSLTMTQLVRDLVPLDWSGSGSSAVALLRANGFRVITRTGSLLFSMPGATTGGRVLPIRQAGLGRERCAVMWESAGEQYLAVADSTGVETPLDLTSFWAHGVAVGDANGDGDDDLFLVSASSHTAKVLLNRSASESYTFALGTDDAESIELASGSPPSGWTPHPVLHDLDQDGDGDLAVYLESETEIAWLPSTHASAEDQYPVVVGGGYSYSWSTSLGHLELHLERPATELFESTHVQMTTWQVIDLGLDSPMDPVAIANQLFAWEGDDAFTSLYLEDQSSILTNKLFISVMRVVELDGTVAVQAGPASVHAFATPESTTEDLERVFGVGVHLRLFEEGEEGEGPPYEFEEIFPINQSERSLAPKDVQINPAPPPTGPPIEGPPIEPP